MLDELAFWPTDEGSSEPDVEVINAVRPGMATIPGAMLLCASSPYARKGALFDAHRRHHGKDGDPVLIPPYDHADVIAGHGGTKLHSAATSAGRTTSASDPAITAKKVARNALRKCRTSSAAA